MTDQPEDDAIGRWEELEADDLTEREVEAIRASQQDPETAAPNDPEVG